MKRLDNKAAIVTGASKGIGAGIAKAFGAEGAAVIVNYARDQAGAERVVREITGQGGRAVGVQGDVAQRSDAQRLVAEAKKAFGRLDVLVNNAGVFSFDWDKIRATFAGHQVKVVVNYGRLEVLEGDPVEGIVIAEFPSFEAAKAWYERPAYQAIRHHRLKGAIYSGLVVQGV
jgi:NAD(P)-dependent dehydrogenase (short-subunit alcohol dehydrogenase family)